MYVLLESKVRELYSLLMDKPNQVLAIFNDFFGEDEVDMQGSMDIDGIKIYISTITIYM